jgi:hypothetical protein
MAANHRTARGLAIDMDRLRLANETTIAVGNMNVNARGDQLGPGGKIIKTRAQIMADANKLHNSPLADEMPISESIDADPAVPDVPQPAVLQPTVEHDTPVAESSSVPAYVKPRGSFADSVASQTEVTQELLDPSVIGLGPKAGPSGPQRL